MTMFNRRWERNSAYHNTEIDWCEGTAQNGSILISDMNSDLEPAN